MLTFKKLIITLPPVTPSTVSTKDKRLLLGKKKKVLGVGLRNVVIHKMHGLENCHVGTSEIVMRRAYTCKVQANGTRKMKKSLGFRV